MWSPLLALVLAQAPTAPAPTPPPAAPAVTDAAPRILVLVPKGDTVDVEVRRAIASTLTVELGKTGRFTALSTSELAQLADLEADKQAAGCDSSSCLSEIAGALGARYVVVGDATQLGGLMAVNLSLFDVERATSVRRTAFEVRDPAEIPARARHAALTLAGADASAAGADGPPLVPLTLLVTGSAVLLGGAAFDMVSPTSNNRALDAGDFVGPAAMLTGAAAMALGALLWGAS